MENAPNLFRNLLLLKATNTEAYTKCMQGVMQNVQEQAICNEEIHMRTPNSYMDYIEFLVKEFGKDNQLEIADLLDENGFEEILLQVDCENVDEDTDQPLQIIKFNPDKKGYERLSFLFGCSFFIYDGVFEESKEKVPSIYQEVEGLEGKYIVVTGMELDYMMQEMICYRLTYALLSEYRHYDETENFKKVMRIHKWTLSLEPSLADPTKGLSLVIRKDALPERCYSYRTFNQFLDAIKLRDSLFEKLNLDEMNHCYFSSEPADISTFEITEMKIKQINKILSV